MIERQRCCRTRPLTHSTLTIQPTLHSHSAPTARVDCSFAHTAIAWNATWLVLRGAPVEGSGIKPLWMKIKCGAVRVRLEEGGVIAGNGWGVLPSFPLLSIPAQLWARCICIVLPFIHFFLPSSFISLSHPVDHHPARFPSADGPLGNRPCPNTPWLTVSPTAVLHSLPTNLSDRWIPHDQTHRRMDTSVTPGDRVRKTGGTTITRDTRKRRNGFGVRKAGGASRRGNVRCICLSGNGN